MGSVGPTYVSLANNVQEQTKVPYVLLDGTFTKTLQMLRLLGEQLDVEDRADTLARYADETLNGLYARIAGIPEAERSCVYYGRGVNGLETGLAGSINLEMLERISAINVASVKAVQEKRIYLAPNLPDGWFDAPPGVNRLIGVRWLTSILYPSSFPKNSRRPRGSSTSSS